MPQSQALAPAPAPINITTTDARAFFGKRWPKPSRVEQPPDERASGPEAANTPWTDLLRRYIALCILPTLCLYTEYVRTVVKARSRLAPTIKIIRHGQSVADVVEREDREAYYKRAWLDDSEQPAERRLRDAVLSREGVQAAISAAPTIGGSTCAEGDILLIVSPLAR